MENGVEREALLYDPVFAKKPPEGWEDSEKGGVFGKAATKKAIFIVFLVLAIGLSLLLSFRSLSKKEYAYDTVESGYRLSEYSDAGRSVLSVVSVVGDNGVADPAKPVTAVRKYAVCCNETLDFIFIGKDVTELEPNCFYYCTNLKAVLTDAENPAYTSVDGVLYSKDLTRIILHPIKNSEYRAALSLGLVPPADESECAAFLREMDRLFPVNGELPEEAAAAMAQTGAAYTVPATVTEIAPFCFSYCDKLTKVDLPAGLKSIGQMGFFKCRALESIRLPEGLGSIGADGLSYCEKLAYIFVPASVKTIGHHAFYGCLGVDAVYLGAPGPDEVETGEGWLPKQNERSLKNVEAVYGAERRDG